MVIFVGCITISICMSLIVLSAECHHRLNLSDMFDNIFDSLKTLSSLQQCAVYIIMFLIMMFMSVISIGVLSNQSERDLQSFQKEAIAAQCGKYVLNESTGNIEFKFISTVKESVIK